MSDQIPIFKVGERCQAMNTSGNVKRGIAAVCGVVKEVVDDGGYGGTYGVALEGRVELFRISGCSLNHVDEDSYRRWRANGVDTSKVWYPA